jgi:catechol 2,3-dioxygenase-like lactoylglutathione lyase family enzyme
MSVVSGLNHVAIMTKDLERFIAFYTSAFGLEVVFRESVPGMKHAVLRIGADSWLHPVEAPGSQHGNGEAAMFQRGHLDHLALTATSREAFAQTRQHLVTIGATDGAVDDLGAYHALWFSDPDGMRGELVLIVDSELRDIHAPRKIDHRLYDASDTSSNPTRFSRT